MKKFSKNVSVLCVALLCMCIAAVYPNAKVQAAEGLNEKCLSLVKGQWYTTNSSGGYDVKFTKTKVKYFDRKSGKLDHQASIKGCKTMKNGYLIKVKWGKAKYSYFLKKNNKEAYFYNGWKKDGVKYSGSSSLSRGKWENP